MAEEVLAAAGIGRLAHQLQVLSELCESLTIRLLELEERVAAVDLHIEPLLAARVAGAAQLSEETELRLDDTEERLGRLEGWLAGLERSSMGRSLGARSQAGHSWNRQRLEEPVEHEEPVFLDEQECDPFVEPDVEDDQRLIA